MNHKEHDTWIETNMEKLKDFAYLYQKSGLLSWLLLYNEKADELLRAGVKPEHLPMIRRVA